MIEKMSVEANKTWEEKENEQYKRDQKVLDEVREMVTPEFYKLIEGEIEETQGGVNFEIIDKPIGEYEDCTTSDIKVWVNQRSVGFGGDSYEGNVCVELPIKKYLKWYYTM